MNYLYSGFNFWKCDSLCWLSVVVTVSGIGEQGEWVTVKENIGRRVRVRMWNVRIFNQVMQIYAGEVRIIKETKYTYIKLKQDSVDETNMVWYIY